MSTVAFLASVVDPRVAASAAKAAMEEFAAIKDQVPAALLDQHLKNVQASANSDGEKNICFFINLLIKVIILRFLLKKF